MSSVSVLVNTPGWEDAVRRLQTADGALGVGLHLNLTTGEPLSAGRSLRHPGTGRLYSLTAFGARAVAGLIDPADVAAECAAQLVRLREAGGSITHLDSHRHVHVLPGVWRPVVETARRQGISVVRLPLEPLGTNPSNWRAVFVKAALYSAWRVAARGLAPPRHAQRFYGISLQGGTAFLPRLLGVLDVLEPGTTELMVHPGYPDGELAGWDDYTWPRVRELEALTSPEVRARFRRGDFQLIHFGAL